MSKDNLGSVTKSSDIAWDDEKDAMKFNGADHANGTRNVVKVNDKPFADVNPTTGFAITMQCWIDGAKNTGNRRLLEVFKNNDSGTRYHWFNFIGGMNNDWHMGIELQRFYGANDKHVVANIQRDDKSKKYADGWRNITILFKPKGTGTYATAEVYLDGAKISSASNNVVEETLVDIKEYDNIWIGNCNVDKDHGTFGWVRNLQIVPTGNMGSLSLGSSLSSLSKKLYANSAEITSTAKLLPEGSTVTLSCDRNVYVDWSKIKVVDGSNNEIALSGTGFTRTFAMPNGTATIDLKDGATVDAVEKDKTLAKIIWSSGSGLTENSGIYTLSKCTGDDAYTVAALLTDNDENAIDNNVTVEKKGSITYTSSNNSVATVNASTGKVTIVGIGNTIINAQVSDGTDYYYSETANKVSYTLMVTHRAEIAFSETLGVSEGSLNKTYGDEDFPVNLNHKLTSDNTVISSGQGSVTFSSSDATVAQIEASTGIINIQKIGTATITATVADNTNYTYPTKSISFTLVVNPRNISDNNDITVTLTGTGVVSGVNGAEMPYTGQPLTPIPTVQSLAHPNATLIAGVDKDYIVDYLNNTNAATHDAANAPTVTITGKGNFTGTKSVPFTITPVTLNIAAKPNTITYGETPTGNGVNYSGFVGSDTYESLGGTLAYDFKITNEANGTGYSMDVANATGTFYIWPKGLTSDNYTIVYASNTLTVNPRPITITAPNETVDYSTSTYDVSGWTATVTSGSLVTGDQESNSHSLTGTTLTVNDATGLQTQKTITPSAAVIKKGGTGDTDLSGNYDITYVPGTLTEQVDVPVASGWTTWYNHYDVDIALTQGGVAVSDLTDITSLAPYIVTNVDTQVATTETGYIQHTTPYLLKYEGTAATPLKLDVVYNQSPITGMDNRFKGCTSPFTADGDNIYVLQGDEFVWSHGSIPENKCYIDFGTGGGARYRSLGINTGDGTTSLSELNIEDMESGDWYDLQGRKLDSMPTKKGLYIMNGKKVVIK